MHGGTPIKTHMQVDLSLIEPVLPIGKHLQNMSNQGNHLDVTAETEATSKQLYSTNYSQDNACMGDNARYTTNGCKWNDSNDD